MSAGSSVSGFWEQAIRAAEESFAGLKIEDETARLAPERRTPGGRYLKIYAPADARCGEGSYHWIWMSDTLAEDGSRLAGRFLVEMARCARSRLIERRRPQGVTQ